jgi:predicted NBD/HSP70 family sugar kinase
MSEGSNRGLRARNRGALIDQLRTRGPLTRGDLVTHTGLSRTTVSNLVGELIDEGLLCDEPEPSGDGHGAKRQGGRPSKRVRLDVSAGVAVSVDIGARHIAVAVGDLGHRVLARHWVPLPHGHGVEQGLTTASRLVEDSLAEARIDRDLVIGAAVGLPAPITHPEGTVASTNILPGWSGVRLGPEVSERVGMPTVVDNDANLGALAEAKWGAGAGGEQVAYIKAATGIGAGLIHDGRLFRGVAGTAGEIGHTTVAEDGPVCRCGSRGCLELYAGGSAVLAALRESDPGVDTVDRLVDLALEGNQPCRRVIADAGSHIGVAVASLVNLLGPDRVVVGGELSRAGDILLDPLRTAVSRSAVQAAWESVAIVEASLGADAEVLGGLLVVITEPWRFGADSLLSKVVPEERAAA